MIGHVCAKGPVHHMHGQTAKNPKAKAKITKAKAKAKIPRTKTGKAKAKMIPKGSSCKGQETYRTFLTKPWNGTENFVDAQKGKTSKTIVGSSKFSNIFDWSTKTQICREPISAKVHSNIWTKLISGRIPPSI